MIQEPDTPAGALLRWYATHQRDLPWRRSRDPYRIWVSEVMLQQTRVETVIPYYERWFVQFPTLEVLAAAPEEQVLKAWEGLGYYSRARNLHQAAREVVARYGGEVPDDPAAVRSLRGVGAYTAGAILSIAFNRPVAAVDGNVLRVLARLYGIEEDIALPSTRRQIEQLAQALIPTGKASSFNQAIMDLGAMVCTPRDPRCQNCPVQGFCKAYAAGAVARLPVKSRAKAPRPVERVAAVLWHGDRLMIRRRPPGGLLGGLWELPGGERPRNLRWERALHQVLQQQHGLDIAVLGHLTRVRHVFSHLVWDVRVYTARLAPGCEPIAGDEIRWVLPTELDGYAFPGAFKKVLAELPEVRPVRVADPR